MTTELVAVVVIAGWYAALFVWARRQIRNARAAVPEAPEAPATTVELLRAARESGRRYEIRVIDQGERQTLPRWRYTIWDADRNLRAEVYGDAGDPEGSAGVRHPYWLGNDDTQKGALDGAVAWVLAEDPGAVMVVPVAGPL